MATKKKVVEAEVEAPAVETKPADGKVRGVFVSDNRTVHAAINDRSFEFPANVEVEVDPSVAEVIGGFVAS